MSINEIGPLLLNNGGELRLSFIRCDVNLFTSIFALFFLLLDLSDDGLLGLLNLLNKVADLLLNSRSLFLDNCALILLSFDPVLNHTDLLISFLGDSSSLRFNECSLVDLSPFFLVNSLGLFLRDDTLSFFLENSLFLSLLLFNGRLFDGNLGDEFGGLDPQIGARLFVLLLLSRILGFLSSSARCLSLDLLLFSNNQFLFVNLPELGELLLDDGFTL